MVRIMIEVGDFVKYTGCSKEQIRWGNNDDPNDQLMINGIYYVTKVDVRSSHTKITLRNIQGRFNSVCFVKMNGNYDDRP